MIVCGAKWKENKMSSSKPYFLCFANLLLLAGGIVSAQPPEQLSDQLPIEDDQETYFSTINSGGLGGDWGKLGRKTHVSYVTEDHRCLFVVWSNLSRSGGGTSGVRLDSYTYTGFHKDTDGTQLTIRMKISEGSAGVATVAGREFKFDSGNILLVRRVRGKGKETVYEMRQISRDGKFETSPTEWLIELSQDREIAAFFR